MNTYACEYMDIGIYSWRAEEDVRFYSVPSFLETGSLLQLQSYRCLAVPQACLASVLIY